MITEINLHNLPSKIYKSPNHQFKAKMISILNRKVDSKFCKNNLKFNPINLRFYSKNINNAKA